jgi:tetratricopeptide (TPR) repeat protein
VSDALLSLLRVVGTLGIALALVACADKRAELKPIPPPDMSAFEPSVRNAITRAQATFDRIAASNPDDATLGAAYGELAMTYHAQDLVAPAAIAYDNARLLASKDKRWPYLQGHLYNDASRVADAIASFEAALAINGNDPPALQSLGQVYLQSGDLDKAQTMFERLSNDKNSRAAALAGLGKVALARHDYRVAIDRFEEALKLWPGATKLRQPLAMAYQGAGDRAKADENLKQYAIDGGEPSVDDPVADALGDKVAASKVLLRRGQRFGKAQRFDLSEKAFRAAVEADPDNAEALANLGISLANLGRVKEAEESLAKSVAMDDTSAVAHLSLGVIYDRQGRDQPAIDQYVAALRRDPDNSQARVYLADAKMRSGSAAEAARIYREALDRSPGSQRIEYSLALADIRAGRHADARRVLEEALARNPGNQLFENALARILATAPDASVRDGSRALQMAKKLFDATRSPEVGVTYAMAFAQNGNFDEAAKLQRETMIAFERAKIEVSKPFLQRNLARYERREPSREGWPDDDPIFSPRAPAVRVTGQ